ncbi:hypothetical protein ID866_1383 [Astraeus odoratus]|nr:hypothetical protein ID866_1383 [Astraeus odoratus]
MKSNTSSVTRTYAPFPSAYPAQPAPYPVPSPSTFAPDSCRHNTQPLHGSPYHRPSEGPQYSVPPPLPPMTGPNPTLPPIRAGEDIDYKTRRPSMSALPNYATSDNRRASVDYGVSSDASTMSKETDLRTTPDYYDRGGQCSLSPTPVARHSADFSSGHDIGTEFSRNSLRCSFGSGSSRSPHSSPASLHGISGGSYPPVSRPQDDGAVVNTPYTYSPHRTTPPYSTNSTSQISLPPPAQLFQPEPPSQLYEVRNPPYEESSGIGRCRVDLAPLRSLQRRHPYRRDPGDDKTLRRLGPRAD